MPLVVNLIWEPMQRLPLVQTAFAMVGRNDEGRTGLVQYAQDMGVRGTSAEVNGQQNIILEATERPAMERTSLELPEVPLLCFVVFGA